MDLREYLFRNRLTVKEFSEALDCSRTHLTELMHGRRKSGKRLANDIEKLTEGQVTVAEIMATQPVERKNSFGEKKHEK